MLTLSQVSPPPVAVPRGLVAVICSLISLPLSLATSGKFSCFLYQTLIFPGKRRPSGSHPGKAWGRKAQRSPSLWPSSHLALDSGISS